MNKSNLFSAWKVIFLLLPFTYACQQKDSSIAYDFNCLQASFQEPGKEYRTAPLWVWNNKMNRESIDFMLGDLKDKGFGGAFVHPRPGLITEYLSEDWFDMFRYSVDKGKELGLNIWIYDENSYPSGFAGGHVPAEMPESVNQGQGLRMSKYELLPDTLSDYFLCLLESGGTYKDITKEIDQHRGTQGQFYVFQKTYFRKSPWYGGFSYVDLLYPGVTEKFLEITMTGYEKVAKEEFGNIVPGVFTDEPEIPSPGGVRWTPDLFDVFQEKWEYGLVPVLPSLFEDVGDWKKVRHNYTQLLLELFIDRWAKPWFEYCEKNNLKWTGHYWEHGWPDLGKGGDNMAMYAWHQMPGIDMLFNQFNESSPRAQFGNVRAVKEVRSAANQLGYERTLCETYGGGGWEVTFKDLKRLGDWTYVLGVNFMNQHLTHSTLMGARKYDYPPVFTYHSPWWPHYRPLNDYFGRLSVALSKGEQRNDMLIIEPTTTLWNYYSYATRGETLNLVGQEFQSFITRLEKAQVEYDLGSETIIKDIGKSENGKFVVGKRSYSTVVIPPLVENIEKHTLDLLIEFAQQGGKIISFSIPDRLNGQTDNSVAAFFNPQSSSVISLDQLSDEIILTHFSNDDIHFVGVTGGNLFHHRREYKDGQFVFLVNSSMDDEVKGTFKMKGKTALEMNGFTGEFYTYPHEPSGKELAISFNIPPAGSLMLFVSGRKIAAPQKAAPPINEQIVETASDLEITPLRHNALKVDFCDLFIDGKEYKNIYFSKASDIVYEKYGFQGNPWNHSVQYKSQIVERDTFKTGGFRVQYKFEVKGDLSEADFKISVERPEIFTVKVNGSPVQPLDGEWFLDRAFPVYDIRSLVRPGTNTVEIQVSPMSVFAEIEPIYVMGDFSVLPAATGWFIDMKKPAPELGSWKDQGLPFYSWEVGYKKSYQVDNTGKSWKVALPAWHGTVAEVVVNGESAGTIGFEPYELDVTGFIKSGNNSVELRVTGSLKNLLGPHFKNPAPGLAGPGHWKNVESDIPGSAYQMMDYGLFENFNLISYE